MNKCIFLDRDGVINIDCVDYTYKVEDFVIISGVKEALQRFKVAGYKLVVITNQSGIAKGIYQHEDVAKCHDYLQKEIGHVIDAFYYSPYHESYSASLSRKPGTLMFEKAIARFDIDTKNSWMIGDKERDLVPAKKLGIQTILLPEEGYTCQLADHICVDLLAASDIVLQ